MPSTTVLSVNAGSSSIKLSLYDTHFGDESPKLILASTISNITSPPASFTYQLISKSDTSSDHDVSSKELQDVKDHSSAFSQFLSHLTSDPRLKDLSITHTCHRVVHGGDFPTSQPLSNSTIAAIKDLTDLAPLHNTPALSLVHATLSHLPDSQNIAYFDSSFHRTLPRSVTTYAISPALANRKGIRRYGFHGISYAFILRSVASHLSKPPTKTSFIALHLGSGCSAVAIKNGESVDTTMGLTPLEGLPGATRSGSIDPSAVFHFTNQKEGLGREGTKEMHVTRAEEILNKECGWKAMTGTTKFSEILERARNGEDAAQVAVEVVVERIVGVVGSYWVKLEGNVDAVVFSGGVGEKSAELRMKVVERLKCLGVRVDEELNEKAGEAEETVVEVGKGEAKVLVCKTDEQEEMVLECVKDERYWKEAKGKQ